MVDYNEAAIKDAQAKWREIDEPTWGKLDRGSVKVRHEALLDLLCAHIPVEIKPAT